jgi:hypothetical protein
LTDDEHKKLQGRYLRAALVLERLEGKKDEQFSEYGHYGENNPPIGVRNE